MWRSNPAYGCWGMIRHLNAQIEATTGELNMVKRQLFHHRQQQQEQQQEQEQQEQYMAATAAMVVPPLGDFQLQPPNFAELVNKYLYSGVSVFDFFFKGNKFGNMSIFFHMYAEDLDAGAGPS